MFLTLSVHVCFVLLEAMGIVALHACKPAILCGIYIEKNMHVKNAYTKSAWWNLYINFVFSQAIV